MTVKETMINIHGDVVRFNAMTEVPMKLTPLRYASLLLRPEIMAVLLYRLGHLFYTKNLKRVASFFHKLNLVFCGADINPASKIGPGCLIVHTVGTIISGIIGKNATLFAHAVIISNDSYDDLSSTPRLGDNVALGALATVIGPVTVANNVIIAPFSLIDESVAEENCMISKTPGEAELKIFKKATK